MKSGLKQKMSGYQMHQKGEADSFIDDWHCTLKVICMAIQGVGKIIGPMV